MSAAHAKQDRISVLVDGIASRAVEAAVGRARLVNTPLREALRERLSRAPGQAGSLLAEPVIEAAFGHEADTRTMAQFRDGGLLHADVAAALARTEPLDPKERNERNTMPLDRRPYTHQAEAWSCLAQEPPRCALISSGTGSGKTEAFLIPILDLLARERDATGGKLTGVRALMVYPLNALIASQRDRLADWTAPFGGDIRFCLYNGQTPENTRTAEAQRTPWEVRDRRTLRADPAPILVTNATMLEYMLVRPIDGGLLQRSRGQLRFVVLDEAHTYLGSQAAEMTLLLRRTLRAFGVEPGQVRFVATSATLGNAEDEARTRKELRTFLAQLAGADEDRVDVIIGRRAVPDLRPGGYGGLADDAAAAGLRSLLARGSHSWSELERRSPGADVAQLLEKGMEAADADDGPFLPLRLHMFHRAQAGVFACPDPACPGRTGTALDSSDWSFGAISERDTACCAYCRARTYEVKTCVDCGIPVLEVGMDAASQRVERWRRTTPIDEFAPEADDDDVEQDDAAPVGGGPKLLTSLNWKGGKPILLDPPTGLLRESVAPGQVALKWFEADLCPCCGSGASGRMLFRPIRMGGPFFLSTAGNVLLDAAPSSRRNSRLPAGGRQLITFTDNRQGTARFAASWQQTFERNFVRSRIWHSVQEREPDSHDGSEEKLRQIEALLASSGLQPVVRQHFLRDKEEMQRQLAARQAGKAWPWTALRDRLSKQLVHEHELLLSWKGLEPRFANPSELANLHLLGEFLRRPVTANSLETMGLAGLRFVQIERLGEAHVPDLLRRHGAGLQDWRDYLYMVLTFYLRANSAVAITLDQAQWIGQRVRQRVALPPAEPAERERWELGWPLLQGLAGRTSRPALMLRDGLGLDLHDPAIREDVNDTLRRAWLDLQALSVPGLAGNAFQLDLTRAEVVPVLKAWLCPRTHRLLDRTFRGLSPYSPQAPSDSVNLRAEPIEMPRLPVAWPQDAAGRDAVGTWLRDDPKVAALRERGLWTDIADRLALLAPYARVVEHSAQQPAWRLREYEAQFKRGEINVLNCSTTMEMGVDIGGITTVAMANVPPSPASYRQRVGRAGRRGEPFAVAFTYCPDSPVGWHAFDRPGAPLREAIRPPRVALESRTLTQRHANALLLAAYLRRFGADATKLEVGWFLGGEDHDARSTAFASWLRADVRSDEALVRGLGSLLRGTGLAGVADVPERSASAMDLLASAWRQERKELDNDLSAAVGAAATALRLQLERFDGEYLLAELVRLAWLPGHGFPTGVVPFVVPQARRITEGGQQATAEARPGYPTRPLDIAVREYAPGADIVLDGVVHRSGGVTLNWKRPADVEAVTEIQAISWFWRCRNCGNSAEATRQPEMCAACGAAASLIDSTRALRPSGFAADPERPLTNAMDWIERVPMPRALVSCAGTPWVALADPQLGRCRYSADGSVMFVSRGLHGAGYAICLACGRAEPEHRPASENPPIPDRLVAHRPLRVRKDKLRCDGGTGARAFAIQRGLAMGHSRRTEVFELQLLDVADECVALTLGAALREALCQTLGIEREEVAFDVGRAPGPGGEAWSIWLFDTAAGGAGYAGTVGTDLTDLLRRARGVLECSNPGCEKACPACLVTRDTAQRAAELDRKAATIFLDALLPRLKLPLALQVFGHEEERLARSPLPAELLRAVEGVPGARLTLLLHGPAKAWDIPRWWGTGVVERLSRAGYAVRLLAAPDALEKAVLGDVLSLRALKDKAGENLSFAAWTARPVPDTLLATVEMAQVARGWAALESKGCEAGPLPPEAVACSTVPKAVQDRGPVDLGARIDALLPTAHRVRIGRELDVACTAFGTRFWELLRSKPGIRAALTGCGPVRSLTYTDRYLLSPCTLRLLHGVLKALSSPAGTPAVVQTMEVHAQWRSGSPTALHHDWPDTTIRDAVLNALLTDIGLRPAVHSLPREALPHARMLRIVGETGAADIILDQGFGFWRSARTAPFAFTANAGKQASDLLSTTFQVAGERNRTTEVFFEPK